MPALRPARKRDSYAPHLGLVSCRVVAEEELAVAAAQQEGEAVKADVQGGQVVGGVADRIWGGCGFGVMHSSWGVHLVCFMHPV